jgi:glucose uptake protein
VLAVSLVVVIAGVLLIVGSRELETGTEERHIAGSYGKGLLLAGAAGCLWGSYFIPSQWAGVAAQVGNFPLALGIAAGGALLAASARRPVRLQRKATTTLLLAGGLFGVGDVALLTLVARVGTGVGFTLAQLSLVVNASIGIYIFKVPVPGSRSARQAIAGILLAGVGGVAIGAIK